VDQDLGGRSQWQHTHRRRARAIWYYRKSISSANVTEGNTTVDVYDEDVKDTSGNYIHRGILDRKIGLYDQNGHLTQFEYYDNGKLKKTTYPDGKWEKLTYDPAGNMTKREFGHADVTTKTINYSYDANNRLINSSGQ
jgi:YD repeat-containing protein